MTVRADGRAAWRKIATVKRSVLVSVLALVGAMAAFGMLNQRPSWHWPDLSLV